LRFELEKLAVREWRHPIRRIRFGVLTIERWYYRAQEATRLVRIPPRKLRNDGLPVTRSSRCRASCADSAELKRERLELLADNRCLSSQSSLSFLVAHLSARRCGPAGKFLAQYHAQATARLCAAASVL
jgi:hypothetical protein